MREGERVNAIYRLLQGNGMKEEKKKEKKKRKDRYIGREKEIENIDRNEEKKEYNDRLS